MHLIDKLTSLFEHFPGIGPRQAQRFVYFLLSQSQQSRTELARLITELGREVKTCTRCLRFFTNGENGQNGVCVLCSDLHRDDNTLLVVEKDIEVKNIERSGMYKGRYFVLGGIVPILEKEPKKRVRIDALSKRLKEGVVKELIVALSATSDGDSTAEYIKETLKKVFDSYKINVTSLGRGLSSGSEVEYSDSETIKNALTNRR